VHLLRTVAWVPQKDGNFVKPCDASRDQLPAGFPFDEGKEWIKKVKFGETATKRSEEYQSANQSAQRFGFETADEAKECAELFRDAKQQGMTVADLRSQLKLTFPTRPVVDPDRREKRLEEQIDGAQEKEYEERERSVRTSRTMVDPAVWLKNQYTNEAGQLICQICKEEMPFRKRDGEYYFEAVEALSKDHFTREHEAQFLALCPLCAAMYREFVKKDESAMETLKAALVDSQEPDIPLRLGELNTSIRFVESHWRDMRTILQAMS
jgi:hypothetical protein